MELIGIQNWLDRRVKLRKPADIWIQLPVSENFSDRELPVHKRRTFQTTSRHTRRRRVPCFFPKLDRVARTSPLPDTARRAESSAPLPRDDPGLSEFAPARCELCR